jgi:hypothetical protein
MEDNAIIMTTVVVHRARKLARYIIEVLDKCNNCNLVDEIKQPLYLKSAHAHIAVPGVPFNRTQINSGNTG